MASSASSRLRVELQARGENRNSWGDTRLNEAFKRLEEAIADVTPIALSGNYTLTSSNYVSDEARSALLKFTGAPAASSKVTIPAAEKLYMLHNTCAVDLLIGTVTGLSPVVRAGQIVEVYCDGTDTFVQDPTLDSIKAAAANVTLAGFKLTNVGTPTAAADAATKGYVDTKTLDTFTAPVAPVSMGGQKITNAAVPTANTDVATKSYVNGFAFNGALPLGTAVGQIVVWGGAGATWGSAPTQPGQILFWNGSTAAWTSVGGVPDFMLQAQGII